jgi:hypothetical protein
MLGQSSLVMLCAGSILLLTPVVRPAKVSQQQLSEVISFSYWSIKSWFFSEENFYVVLIIRSSWGFPNALHYTTSGTEPYGPHWCPFTLSPCRCYARSPPCVCASSPGYWETDPLGVWSWETREILAGLSDTEVVAHVDVAISPWKASIVPTLHVPWRQG